MSWRDLRTDLACGQIEIGKIPDEFLTALIIQLIDSALCGDASRELLKRTTSLRPIGDTIAGALGGGAGGQLLSTILGLGYEQAAAATGEEALLGAGASGSISTC